MEASFDAKTLLRMTYRKENSHGLPRGTPVWSLSHRSRHQLHICLNGPSLASTRRPEGRRLKSFRRRFLIHTPKLEVI